MEKFGFPVLTFTTDAEGRYQAANQQFLEAAGLEHEQDLIGRTDLDLPWGGQIDMILCNERCQRSGVNRPLAEHRFTAHGWREYIIGREWVNSTIQGRMADISLRHHNPPQIDVEGRCVRVGNVRLSEKEFRVARSLYWGMARKKVAHDLQIAEKSIDYYKEQLRKKFGVKSTADLFRVMNESGLACILIKKTDWLGDSTGTIPSVSGT